MTAAPDITVVVLCGGTSRRFGSDKLAADLGGHSVLDRTLMALPHDWPTICVGPRRATIRDVAWAREDPIGCGPAAAVAAGLRGVTTPLVAVLAGDMPLVGSHLPALRAAVLGDAHLPGATAVVATWDGRPNPLCAVAHAADLRNHLRILGAGIVNAPARVLWSAGDIRHQSLDPDTGGDVDTPDDLARVAAALREQRPGTPGCTSGSPAPD